MKYSAIIPPLSCWCCKIVSALQCHAPVPHRALVELTGFANLLPSPRHVLQIQSRRSGALYPPSLSPTKPHILISYSSKVQCHLTNIMLQISSKTINWCLDTVPSSHLIQRGSTKTEEGEESKTNQPTNKPHIYTHMIYTCT